VNQNCSPRGDLSNDLLHSQFGGREEVDSRLLVVGSQTGNLTPDPSFAHNLGYRCPNGQCEAIFDIYALRAFQWHQEHLNAGCFGPCCRTLNIRESRRTPSPQLWECWASPPHLAKVGLWHFICCRCGFLVQQKILGTEILLWIMQPVTNSNLFSLWDRNKTCTTRLDKFVEFFGGSKMLYVWAKWMFVHTILNYHSV
jgi:hypothetical protein